MPDRNPGIKLHPHPEFENRRAKLGALPDLNLRWAFVGTSGSGKGVAMLDLLLRHYRGVFDRILKELNDRQELGSAQTLRRERVGSFATGGADVLRRVRRRGAAGADGPPDAS